MPDATDTTEASTDDTTSASTEEETTGTLLDGSESTEADVQDEAEGSDEKTALDYIDADGTFKEGWESLIPEDFRGRKVFHVFGDLRGLLKQLGHQDKLLGDQKRSAMMLPKNPTETDIEVYRKLLGVPDTPDEYEFKTPEGLETHYDQTKIAEAFKAFHEANLTPAQVEAVMAFDAARVKATMESDEQKQATERDEVESVLREDWGDKFDANLRLANRVIAEHVSEDEREEVLEVIGNNAKVAKLFAQLGDAFLEDSGLNTDNVGSRGTIQSRITALQNTPGYLTGELRNTNRAEHDRIDKELERLYARKYPQSPSGQGAQS